MPVGFEVKNHVAYVTLNRPEAMNALDPESVSDLNRIWHEVASKPDIVTAFSHDLRSSADAAGIWIGSALVLVSSLVYALYLVGSGQVIQRIGASRFTALAMLVSTFATLIHFVVTQPLASLLQPWPIYAIGAAMSLFSTVLPVFALSQAIRHIGAGRAALIGCVGPLLTIFFGYWLLDEAITPLQVVGALLVVAGVFIVGRQ